jgi:hypothetical protein
MIFTPSRVASVLTFFTKTPSPARRVGSFPALALGNSTINWALPGPVKRDTWGLTAWLKMMVKNVFPPIRLKPILRTCTTPE